MRRGGGVDGQALGVADVGQVGEEREALDQALPGLAAALDPEDHHAAVALR